MKKTINLKLTFRYLQALYIVCFLHPVILFSQNTATVSGNWNDCETWGNPAAIYRNTTDTKTIKTWITVTANENWSTSAINLEDYSTINFSGSTILDFTTDQGADKSCIKFNINWDGRIATSIWPPRGWVREEGDVFYIPYSGADGRTIPAGSEISYGQGKCRFVWSSLTLPNDGSSGYITVRLERIGTTVPGLLDGVWMDFGGGFAFGAQWEYRE